MLEIIKKHEVKFGAEQIRIVHNPQHVRSLQLLSHTRLYIFKKSEGTFHVDFYPQEIVANTLYITPPFHFQFFRKKLFTDFICVDIGNRLLKPYHKQLLFFIKYNKQKSFAINTQNEDLDIYETLLGFAENLDFEEQDLLDLITTWVEDSLVQKGNQILKYKRGNHINDAENFLALLHERELTNENCKINLLALKLLKTERNLHRICKRSFGLSAKNVVNYHLALKATYLLSKEEESISKIAADLHFSDAAVFARYIRRVTGITPSQIKANSQQFRF